MMPAIDANTRLFGVFGHPIRHSLSPAMHNAAYAQLGMNAAYLAFDVTEDGLQAALDGLRALNAGGVNLTIPLKRRAFEILPRLDPTAKLLGAVNTVAFHPDGMTGYNTDGTGFLRDLKAVANITPRDRRVLVLGCGGAGRALALTCATEGAAEIALTEVLVERAQTVAAEIKQLVPSVRTSTPAQNDWPAAARAADLIIHCTPVGMHAGDKPMLDASAFRPGQVVYDLVYVEPETPTMRVARAGGATAFNGLGMLVNQGAVAFAIWTGREPDVKVMRAAIEPALHKRPA